MGKRKRKIAVGDCETDPFKLGRVPKPFIWGYFDGEEYHEFENASEFVAFVEEEPQIIYFHNGGKFDYFYMLHEMEAFREVTIINGRIAKFKIGEAEFRDSINILPVALKTYKKDDFDYTLLEEDVREKHMPKIKIYLENDCRYLYELVMAFIEQYGTNLTVASTALKQWKQIKEIDVPESDAFYYDKFSKYYYGGRTECFKKGIFEGKFESYDINSAYPYAMQFEHPYGLFHIENKEPKDGIKGANFYTIKAESKGALPLRTDKGLTFPHETNIYHVSGWELLAGIETKTVNVLEYIKEVSFPEKRHFKEYVNHFYEMKKKADKSSPEYIFAKLFMNSLYGKFAANPEKYNEFMICEKNFIEAAIEDGYEFSGELGKWALMRKDLLDCKKKYYNICTAASITGFVRAFLFKHIHALNKSGNDVMYCDTDSIFFENNNEKRPFDIGEELGQWEKEYDYTDGAIAGKKLYAFIKENGQYKKASKGCNLSGKEIFAIAKGDEIEYKDIAPVYSVYKKPYFQVRKIRKT